MSHIKPLRLEDVPSVAPVINQVASQMGFVPNSLLTMARRPEVLSAFGRLVGAVMGPGTVTPELKLLITFIASTASGCRYCQAHAADVANRSGESIEKLGAAWSFETDDRFNEAERAALQLARDASVVPNAVASEHFENLMRHFSEEQIVEIVAAVSLMGWLNRWNDTMATELEEAPRSFASRHLESHGWSVGKHA